MKHVVVIPPRDDGLYVTREIGDSIYNHSVHINPYNAVVYATKLRQEGETVEIIDGQALKLTPTETWKRIRHFNPDVATYFISCFGVQEDLACVDWKTPHKFVVSPIKTDTKELINLYPYPFSPEDFITDPKWFTGRADFSLLDIHKYSSTFRINLSDFCPYECVFCCRCRMQAPQKPVEDTVDEIIQLKKLGFSKFLLFGSEISIDKNVAFQLAEELSPLKVGFTTLDRVDLATAETYKALAEAGCSKICFGVESGSQHCLDFLKKHTTPEDAVAAFHTARQSGIKTRAHFIIGIPNETCRDLYASIRLAWKLNPDELIVNMLYPSPSSPFYNWLISNRLLKIRDWKYYKHYHRRRLAYKHARYTDIGDLQTIRNLLYATMSPTKALRKLLH